MDDKVDNPTPKCKRAKGDENPSDYAEFEQIHSYLFWFYFTCLVKKGI